MIKCKCGLNLVAEADLKKNNYYHAFTYQNQEITIWIGRDVYGIKIDSKVFKFKTADELDEFIKCSLDLELQKLNS